MKIKLSGRMMTISTKKNRTVKDYHVGQGVKITDKDGLDYGTVTEVKDRSIMVKVNYTPSPLEFYQQEFSGITPL